ncbi:MAG: hypothetical protein ABT23_14310 [Thiobacillus sp. SCN 63-57]|nr:MAG: hypothetical protein ABT23_14310 [Thiobacillus sp. SCN 63-57]
MILRHQVERGHGCLAQDAARIAEFVAGNAGSRVQGKVLAQVIREVRNGHHLVGGIRSHDRGFDIRPDIHQPDAHVQTDRIGMSRYGTGSQENAQDRREKVMFFHEGP